MIIGNLKIANESMPLEKWIIGFDLRIRPPYSIGHICPYLFVIFYKIVIKGTDHAKVDGTKSVTKGFYRSFVFPYGFSLNIVHRPFRGIRSGK